MEKGTQDTREMEEEKEKMEEGKEKYKITYKKNLIDKQTIINWLPY